MAVKSFKSREHISLFDTRVCPYWLGIFVVRARCLTFKRQNPSGKMACQILQLLLREISRRDPPIPFREKTYALFSPSPRRGLHKAWRKCARTLAATLRRNQAFRLFMRSRSPLNKACR